MPATARCAQTPADVAGPAQTRQGNISRTDQSLMNTKPDIDWNNVVHITGQQPSPSSPLVNYALNGLRRCWMPEHGRWSHIYHLDGRSQPNQSLPASDVFYTLNVLLGLSRLQAIPDDIDCPAIFERNVLQLPKLPVAKYAYGMALWSAAELKLEVPPVVAKQIETLLLDTSNWARFRAQDIGMLLTGLIAQARAGGKQWQRFITPVYAFLAERYTSQSGLFFDEPYGLRRRFASFASQTYLTLACFHYAEFSGRLDALETAKTCTRKLIGLQGPQGEWPWFFDAERGCVLDYYEVYSVHQYGMAPAFLECAERHGVSEAREALIRGFKWVLGDNQLRRSMLVPDLQLTIRSQVREKELRTSALRMVRAVRNAYLRRPADLIDPAGISVRLECRSYELGWILWSFGRRSDLRQLTHDPAFSTATA